MAIHEKSLIRPENLKTHEQLSGWITGLKFTDEMYEGDSYKKFHLYLQDGDEEFILGLDAGNRYAGRILKMLPNVDFNKAVEISLMYKEEGGKKDSSAFIKQDGVNVKQFWSREEPKELPQPTTYSTPEKEVNWSYKEQNEYLMAYMLGYVKPMIDAALKQDAVEQEEYSQEVPNFDDDGDDAPF